MRDATTSATTTNSLVFFLWMPSMSLPSEGTLEDRPERPEEAAAREARWELSADRVSKAWLRYNVAESMMQ